MKKIITSIVVILVLLTISACNGSSESSESNGTPYVTYKEALAADDFVAAYRILAHAEADKNVLDYDEFNRKYGFTMSDLDVVKNEVLNREFNFLAVQGDDAANKRLMVLLNEQPMEGVARSEGQVIEEKKVAYYADMDNLDNMDYKYYKYVKWCNAYNSRCLTILEIAVNTDNKELAQMMVNTIKPNPEIITKPYPQDNDYKIVYAHYTTHSKDVAIAKYEQKFGKFEDKQASLTQPGKD